MIKIQIILSAVVSLLFLTSCGKDDNDNTPPQISIQNSTPTAQPTMICGSMEENVFRLYSGDSLKLFLNIEDNEELSQVKFDIHSNFDCHGHGGSQAPGFEPPDIGNQSEDWTVLDIRDLNGRTQELNVALHVPDNVTNGVYHLGMQALDEAGNESSSLIYDMSVMNRSDTMAPEIVVDTPQSMQLERAKGELITFEGTVFDNQPLEEGGNGVIFLTYEHLQSEQHYTGPFLVFEEGSGTEVKFSIEFAFPETVTEGMYKLYLNAHDGVRNLATPVEYDVQVSN